MPRQATHQQHRSNIPASSEIQYFKCSLYIPFLDSLLQEFHDWFLGHDASVFHLSAIVPAHLDRYVFGDLLPAFHLYETFMDSESQVKAEFDMWKQKWLPVAVHDRPNTAIQSLPLCCRDIFPNMRKLFLITATLPVTTATPEQTFFFLRLLKSHLRTTMDQDRLAGLTLLYLHRDIPVSADQVIDRFARQCRRTEFAL